MIAKLIEIGPKSQQTREIPLTKDDFLIGRGPDCDLRLNVSSISRHHCLLRVRGEEVTVTDLGSSNGTFLNGQRVRSQAALLNGDELVVGQFHFVVRLGSEEGIMWHSEPDSDPTARTFKLREFNRSVSEAEEKERGHPPGDAGGQGDSAGKESG
jgi:pSer/pThr/pTyr-binding forkhead associated (FHA) protein